MDNFALLFQSIVRSSLWIKGTKEMRILFITLLALKDTDGRVRSSFVGLADMAKLEEGECRKALQALMSPDPDDTSKVDDGRRVREIPGGWEVVNHDMYRFSTEAKREFWRQQKQEQREREELAKAAKARARVLTPKQKAAFDEAKAAEYKKRTEPRFSAKRAGQVAGGTQAVADGLAQDNGAPGVNLQ